MEAHVDETRPTTPILFIKIPLQLLRYPHISFAAKCLYGRLLLFSGENGVCHPSHATLASELGISTRRVKDILIELRDRKLVTWKRTRMASNYVVSSSFEYLPQDRQKGSYLGPASNKGSQLDRNIGSHQIGSKVPTKRGPLKEVSSREVDLEDIYCSKRRKQPLSSVSFSVPEQVSQYPRLKRLLEDYMAGGNGNTVEYSPSERQVVDIMHASDGGSEQEVIECLKFLWNERGLQPGTDNGPRKFAWFASVVADEFDRVRRRQEAARPIGHEAWEGRNEKQGYG